jgi:putative transposase
LNQNWFLSLPDARDKIEAWRQGYNRAKPQSSLENLTPRQSATLYSSGLAYGRQEGSRAKKISL